MHSQIPFSRGADLEVRRLRREAGELAAASAALIGDGAYQDSPS
ncbi:MAG TPA: hypothetical protein VMV07_04745 [Streptosporangiaceae bacterium]|nr:hypothetical protein [Streptosporangiaceae bacterium]